MPLRAQFMLSFRWGNKLIALGALSLPPCSDFRGGVQPPSTPRRKPGLWHVRTGGDWHKVQEENWQLGAEKWLRAALCPFMLHFLSAQFFFLSMRAVIILCLLLLLCDGTRGLRDADAALGPREWQHIAQEPGTVHLDSGVLYKVLREGEGGGSPRSTDLVRVHYHGALLSGTVFDQAHARVPGADVAPAKFLVSQAIRGIQDALQRMTVGDIWDVYVPAARGYGSAARAGAQWSLLTAKPHDSAMQWYFPQPPKPPVGAVLVPADSPLHFRVELVAFQDPHFGPKDPDSPLTCPTQLEEGGEDTAEEDAAGDAAAKGEPSPGAEEPPTRCPYKKLKRFVKRGIAEIVSKVVLLLPSAHDSPS